MLKIWSSLSSFQSVVFTTTINCPTVYYHIQPEYVWRIRRLARDGTGRDGTAEPVSRDQILRHVLGGQGNIHFHCSADHEQDW